ncbi:MAG: OsmC family protein [Spirochaetales bacterium]
MKITVKRLEAPYYLEATNEEGNTFTMDASPDIGGTGRGFRPMQTLLGALGGCSTIDVVTILKNSKQRLDDIQLFVEGHRTLGVEPSLFETIHVHFVLTGEIEDSKAEFAVKRSMEKYCSVAKTLEPTAKITFSWDVKHA